jgi:hypothetical protein
MIPDQHKQRISQPKEVIMNRVKTLLTAALALAITFTLSCSNDGGGGGGGSGSSSGSNGGADISSGSGGGSSKVECIREALGISAYTLNDIAAECGATKGEVLSLLPSTFGTCKAKDLEFDKPIKKIREECGVDEIPTVSSSSSSKGNTGGSSSSSGGGSSSSNRSSSSTASSSSQAVPGSSSASCSPSGSLCDCFVEGTPRNGGQYDGLPQFCDERDGKKYVYVEIGGKKWMAENINHDDKTNSRCYGDDTGGDNYYCEQYGRLYDGWAANYVCPEGWHLPSDAEWGVGESSLLGYPQYGGNGYSYGYFYDVGDYGGWWSSSEFSNYAYNRRMGSDGPDVYRSYGDKDILYSVRCVQD